MSVYHEGCEWPNEPCVHCDVADEMNTAKVASDKRYEQWLEEWKSKDENARINDPFYYAGGNAEPPF